RVIKASKAAAHLHGSLRHPSNDSLFSIARLERLRVSRYQVGGMAMPRVTDFSRCAPRSRQIDRDRGSLAELTINHRYTAALSGKFINAGETEPGAFAR